MKLPEIRELLAGAWIVGFHLRFNPTYKIAQTESLCYEEADSTSYSVEVMVGWGDPAPTMMSFVDRGLRGLCVVGIVYCLNQDFQDYRIFRIGRGLYTFRQDCTN